MKKRRIAAAILLFFTKFEKMFEKLLTKQERMLYIVVEQKFARTKERVPGEKQSGLWDSSWVMIQAASKKKEETNMLQVRTYCISWAVVVMGVSLMLHVLGVA